MATWLCLGTLCCSTCLCGEHTFLPFTCHRERWWQRAQQQWTNLTEPKQHKNSMVQDKCSPVERLRWRWVACCQQRKQRKRLSSGRFKKGALKQLSNWKLSQLSQLSKFPLIRAAACRESWLGLENVTCQNEWHAQFNKCHPDFRTISSTFFLVWLAMRFKFKCHLYYIFTVIYHVRCFHTDSHKTAL